MFELGSGLSILLHGSVSLFLGLGCAVSVPRASPSSLISEIVILASQDSVLTLAPMKFSPPTSCRRKIIDYVL